MPQFEDIASEETNQEGDNLIHLEEEVLPNAEENSEIEQLSSNEGGRLEEVKMAEAEEESLNERSVSAEVIEYQSERERGMEQNIVLQSKYKDQLPLDRRQCLEKRFCTQ